MKEKNENKLDQLFKDGLSGSEDHIAFREEDWAAMERLLDNKPSKKAVIMRRIYYASGIAAILLLAIGIFFFTKNNTEDKSQDKLYGKNKTETNKIPTQGDNDHSGRPLKDSVPELKAGSESLGGSSVHGQQSKKETPSLPADRNGHYLPGTVNQNIKPSLIAKTTKDSANNGNNAVVSQDNKVVEPTNISPAASQSQNNIAANQQPDTTATTSNPADPLQQVKKDKPSIKPILKRGGPRLTLSILAAPDLNAVNSFSNNQVGTNLGFQLGIQLSKKFSISTGASYAIKPYQATASQYNSVSWQGRPASSLPSYVSANCKVLDIPVNLNYRFYSKGRDAFALGTGLSSYIMLRENYHFDFADGSGTPSYDIQINNRNQHILGVLNLNATYERRINSKFSTVVQPYMKLPLTGIGTGRVDLRSTGVALGITWNITPGTRPK
ncbi:MAG: hypothetical protein AAGC65_20635 [Mucilaginibacter sp.]|uniref:hypothetical protein n=1 Tax=Mucilaginibacter sp. TaxID=1882438 RepID=UPI0031A74AF3